MDLLSIYRVKNWWYYLGYPLLGFAFADSFNGWYVILLLTALTLAYTYSINEKYDKDTEAYDFLLPLLLSFLLVPFLNTNQAICFVLFVTISTLYSHRLTRLKSIPFIVTIANGTLFSLLFCTGYLGTKGPDLFMFHIFTLIFFFNIGAQLIHELMDLKEDLDGRINTTVVYLGERQTVSLLVLSFLFGIIHSLYLYLIGVLSALEFPLILMFWIFSLLTIRSRKWDVARRRYRYAGTIVGGLLFLSKITF